MEYNPKLDRLMIETSDAKEVYFLILYCLKQMRLVNGLPLDKYKREGLMTEHDHGAVALLDIAVKLGIDMGVTPHHHNHLDLREVDE